MVLVETYAPDGSVGRDGLRDHLAWRPSMEPAARLLPEHSARVPAVSA